MTNFESKEIPLEDIKNTVGKENKRQEYKSNSTKWHEEEAEKAKEEIKKLNEESKKLVEVSEKLIKDIEKKKKESDGLSS